MARSGWQRSDTLILLAVFLIPLLTMIWVISDYSTVSWQNFSPIELDWTTWAGVGVVVGTYKVYVLAEDQRAIGILDGNWRRWLGGLWSLANAVGLLVVFLLLESVGLLVGQVPAPLDPPEPVAGLPIGVISGVLFMGAERVLLVVLVFGLLCRHRLGK